MRARNRPAPNGSRDRWLISYADFITLLFAFFTTMYAISTVDAAKLASIGQGLQRAFDSRQPDGMDGVLPGGRGVVPGAGGLLKGAGADARTRIRERLADDARAGRVELSEDSRGVIVSIPESGAFGVGSADLSPAAGEVLARLAGALADVGDAVRVEGHTDDTPIHTPRFTSNWELSTARATTVVQFLIERGQLAPDRLSAAGYGEFHPRADNATADGRARNRRVDVIVLTAATRVREEPRWQEGAR